MPIPLFVWAAAAGLGALGFGAVWVYGSAKNKRVTVLGPRKSGKSTLIDFLATGEIPQGYTPTHTPRVFEKTVKLKDLKLKLAMTDVSGDKSAWRVWRDAANQADLVCFLAPVPMLNSESEWELLSRAGRQVGSWEIKGQTALVVTFIDTAPEMSADDLRAMPRVAQLRRLLGQGPILLVNLTDNSQQHELGYRILEMLK